MRFLRGAEGNVRFEVLGPLNIVADDGGTVAVGGPKPRAVLAILLLAEGRTVAVPRLVDGVWGEDAGAGAERSLQVHVSNLRKVIDPRGSATAGPRRLITSDPGYRLDLQPTDSFDLTELEGLVADARRSLDSGDPIGAVQGLDRALALWRGEPLADLADAPFQAQAATRLTEAHLQAVELRLVAKLAEGAHDQLVHELETLVVSYPFRERLWGHLMVALYRSGRQAEALGAFERARTVLVEELGVDPSPQLEDLHRKVLDQDPELEAPVVGDPPAPPVPSAPTMEEDLPTVILVDDHPMWLDTLTKVLTRWGAQVIARARDGDEAARIVADASPDVIVMDMDLPTISGVEATARVLEVRPDARVLVLSGSEERAKVIAAVQAGASGYLLKTVEPEDVCDAVRRVHAGELVFPPALAGVVLDEFRRRGSDVSGGSS